MALRRSGSRTAPLVRDQIAGEKGNRRKMSFSWQKKPIVETQPACLNAREQW
jgi:hypothetical protein